MATIKVRVQGEIATNLTPEVKLVCQNEKYNVEFEFDESWANSNFKTALFIYNGQLIAIPFDGTICKIPALYETELLHIGVKSNDVVGLHTTTPAKVVYLLSANDLTSNKIPEPSKDVYDEIIALLNKYISGGGSIDLSDYQKKVDENLPTSNKTIVGAIAEVKEIAETAKMVFGETEGTAYEGNKGKANADNIAKLQNELSIVNVALEQSGLVKKYKQPIEQEYTERITADGANVLDGSKAVLKKVVGNTVACKNLFNPDRTEQDLGAVSNTTPRVFEENKYFVGLTSNNYYYRRNVGDILYNNGEFSFLQANPVNSQYGVGFAFFANEGEQYTLSYTGENATASVAFYKADGTYVSSVNTKTFTIPTGCSTFVVVFTPTDAYSVTSVRNIQIEQGTTATEYQPYFTGLKSASFGGIESTNADGTETATLAFPKTETPLGTTIDFEAKKITNYGVDLVLTGTENWMYYTTAGTGNGVSASLLPYNVRRLKGVSTDGIVEIQSDITSVFSPNRIWLGVDNKGVYWTGVLDILTFTTAGTTPTEEEKTTAITNFKAWLAQRYADGNPVTIRYVSLVLQSETDFTADNEYIVNKGGTEKVIGNDGAEYGADNTLTQDYILVTEVK